MDDDQQDVPLAVLRERVRVLDETVGNMGRYLQKLRDDKMRIEGGKWLLWVIGSAIIGAAGIFYSVSNSPDLRAFFWAHGR
jgi:hypothetical protein